MKVCPDNWVLDRRLYKKKTHGKIENTIVNNVSYCLGVDGSLFVLVEGHEEILGPGITYSEDSHDPGTREMNDDDVQLFDYESGYFHRADGSEIIENMNVPDRRKLKFDTKGVGLSMALKNLLGDS